jgi:DNA adenine methylase
MSELKAPFPYFGGKSRIASQVWARFGDVANYVEPFFGSGAVLLSRPTPPKTETVNDADGLLVNFWRAVQADPDAVAKHADWPPSEVDLYARHAWLRSARADVERMLREPEWFDAKLAGWWVWGAGQWIGRGWGRIDARQYPRLSEDGKNMRARRTSDYLRRLSRRLGRVRITCGDWARLTSPNVTIRHGCTAVFLDPPYSADLRDDRLYAVEGGDVAAEVREWAIENGDDPMFRIALCGYDIEHDDLMPPEWERLNWKSCGGYSRGNGRGRENASRETVWFSPHCLERRQTTMFEFLETTA